LRVLRRVGLHPALPLRALCRGAVSAAVKAARCLRRGVDHDRCTLPRGAGRPGPGALYNARAKFYSVYSGDSAVDHDLRISHLAYDRTHTTAEDPNTWFPLAQLRRSAAAGRLAAVASRFHGMPTNRSQRVTIGRDCPEIVARCREDGADAAILVAN
jgi:hypothetical protein